jgi:hypothetical protein
MALENTFQTMADIKHLLYILPDVAYAVELMPSGESGNFSIRDYLQVNGDFMDENELIEENLKKLISKLQPQAYDLILPDFLFTNTVVNIEKTGEEEVKKYLQTELIPSLEISDQTHAIQTFVLTEFKGSSKAQLSALELSIMDPLRAVFTQKATIKNIYPLSWTLKSLISLEPSISIVQMGANLYLAQHYIGVDQANSASVDDANKLVETVKTLKGAEASIQTLYLLSSALVESKLKEGLKNVLPLQQLANETEGSEMPSYVKQAVEAGAKTLSVADYKIPVFTISAGKMSAASAVGTAKKEIMSDKTMSDLPEEKAETSLPTPTEVGGDEPKLEFADESQVSPVETTAAKPEEASIESVKPEDVDLSQFSSQADEETTTETPAQPIVKESQPKESVETPKKNQETVATSPALSKPVIKNDRGTNSMVIMIFIGLASFFVTVGIGLGIGLGLLTFTKPGEEVEPTPVVETTPTPEVTPTPAPEIKRTDFTVRVVNATAKAGYAGTVAADLEEAGFEDVATGNALGDYETGNYVLLDEEDVALLELLSKDTGLDLTFATGKEVEDSATEYKIVIVLAE